jgi:hypothetical protein
MLRSLGAVVAIALLAMVVFGLMVADCAAAGRLSPNRQPITRIGDIVEPGLVLGVTPSPQPQSPLLYATVTYVGGSFDLVAVDPTTGTVQTLPTSAPGEAAAWGMTAGPNDTLYLGTAAHAELVRVDLVSGVATNLGTPEPGEQWIWGLTESGGDIYGCTYPSAKLFRYDPQTGLTTDLGRMDPIQEYARSCVAGGDGYIYVAIGTALDDMVAYDISTGQYQDLVPATERQPGVPYIFQATNGQVYAAGVGTTLGIQHFLLNDGTATPVSGTPPAVLTAPTDEVDDVLDGGSIAQAASASGPDLPVNPWYRGKPLYIFDLATGPDDAIYASTVLPPYLARIGPKGSLKTLGKLPSGEVYSTLSYRRKLILATYAGTENSDLEVYDPSRPFAPGPGAGTNPQLVTLPGGNNGWRPQTMVDGPDGNVYIGSVPGYGFPTGAITVWNPSSDASSEYEPIADQSITSLAVLPGSDGRYLAGGTSVGEGGGIAATTTAAKLFLWNTSSHSVTDETPIPNASTIADVVPVSAHSIFAFSYQQQLVHLDPTTHALQISSWPCGVPLLRGAFLRRGQIIVVNEDSVCTIDPRTSRVRVLFRWPPMVTTATLSASRLYFATTMDKIYAFALPSYLRS